MFVNLDAKKITGEDITLTGDATIGDDLTVTDDASVGGDLAVTGAASVGGALTITGSSGTLIKDGSGNILLATGTTVPTDGTAGYAKSCLFIDTDVDTGTGALYLNKGTTAACAFTLVTQA